MWLYVVNCSERCAMSGAELVKAAPTCAGVRKRDGAACRSKILLEDGYCHLHSPTAAVDHVAFAREAGVKSGESRREAAKTVRQRLRQKVEEHVEDVWAAFRDALTATDDEGAPDMRTRLVAAQALLAESYGKPAITLEGNEEKPLRFIVRSAFELEQHGTDELLDADDDEN